MGYKEADPEESIAGRDEVSSGIPFFTPKAGERGKFLATRVRILPPRDDHPNNKFYQWVAVHGQVGSLGRPILCPYRMHDEACPVCAESQRLRRQGLEDDAIELSAKWRGMVNVIKLEADGSVEDDPQILVWGMPKGVLEDLLGKMEELPKRERNITSPTSGRDVIIRRKGAGKKTRYEIELVKEASELDEDAIEFLNEGLHDLTTIYPKIEFVKIAGLLAGGSGAVVDPFGDVPEEPEEDEPKPKSKKDKDDSTAAARERLRRKISNKKEDEDDEDDEDD